MCCGRSRDDYDDGPPGLTDYDPPSPRSGGALEAGTAASDTDGEGEGDPTVRCLLEGQARLIETVTALQKRLDDGGGGGTASSSARTEAGSAPANEEDVDAFVRAIDGHIGAIDRDKAAREKKVKEKKEDGHRRSSKRAFVLEDSSSSAVSDDDDKAAEGADDDDGEEEIRQELEQMKRLARSAKKEMLRKAARYRRKVPWKLPRGWKKRLALPFLLHAHRDGKSVTELILRLEEAKELKGHPNLDVMKALARALDLKVMDEAARDMVNEEAVELMVRKLWGFIKSFDAVQSRKDWETPKGGAPRGWKSKVNFEVLAEYDVMTASDLLPQTTGTDGELRRRLKERALLQKHLSGAEGS